MKENSNGTDTNVGTIGNSIEEDIELLQDETSSLGLFFKCKGSEKYKIALEHILSDYKRVLKENEIYKKNSEIMSKENLSTAEQLKVEIKENFRLKNQLENNRKEYQETYKDVREELKELKKENEELKIIKFAIQTLQINSLEEEKYIVISKGSFLDGSYKHLLDDYIPKQKVKDIIDRIDYDIKKTKEIISKNTNIYASYRKNDYQIVRLRAMNTKSLDIKKRLQELLESEE